MNCPVCNKKWIAEIFWGYIDVDEIKEELEKKEIVLGGCNVRDNDPRWECNYCHNQWGRCENQ